jgi:hypothetical protein
MISCCGVRAPYLAAMSGLISLLAFPCYASNWQQVGQPPGAVAGLAYLDLDSLREEGGFRVATFLTIYAAGEPNANNIKLDRIAQETAFDCAKRTFSLLSTVGYLGGKKVGTSSDNGDWRDAFKPIPTDDFSRNAYNMACKLPVATRSEGVMLPAESPGTVALPGPVAPPSQSQHPGP